MAAPKHRSVAVKPVGADDAARTQEQMSVERHMDEHDPQRGLAVVIAKFIVSALAGWFVSFVLLACLFDVASFWRGPWKHVLWAIPLFWGALGILWFDQMLELARDVFDRTFGPRD